MKVIVKDAKKAQAALKTNRPFTVGQILEADKSLLEIAMHQEPEAFESSETPKKTFVPAKEEAKEDKKVSATNKKFKKGKTFRTKGW